MTSNQGPVVQSALLRTELTRLRMESGLTREQVAKQLDWPPSKLIRVEGGRSAVTKADLDVLLTLYGVSCDRRRERLRGLHRDSREQAWWAMYSEQVHPAYVGYETRAATAQGPTPRRPLLGPGWRLGAGAGVVGASSSLGWICPLAAVVLVVLEVALPLVLLVVAGAVAIFGSEQTSGRVFRLLRLVTGREEPKGPSDLPVPTETSLLCFTLRRGSQSGWWRKVAVMSWAVSELNVAFDDQPARALPTPVRPGTYRYSDSNPSRS